MFYFEQRKSESMTLREKEIIASQVQMVDVLGFSMTKQVVDYI